MPEEIEVKVKLSSGDYYFPVVSRRQAAKVYWVHETRRRPIIIIAAQKPTLSKKVLRTLVSCDAGRRTYKERTVSCNLTGRVAHRCNAKMCC